ncbi:MAG: S8 family serine peptidase [Luteibaculaceae bacterium]
MRIITKSAFLVVFTCVTLFSGVLFSQAETSKSVNHFILNARNSDKITVVAMLPMGVDLWAMHADFKVQNTPQKVRAKTILQTLKQTSGDSQQTLISNIPSQFKSPADFTVLQQHWINNTLIIQCNKAFLQWLIQQETVAVVVSNTDFEIALIEPTKIEFLEEQGSRAAGAPEPGLLAVGAQHLWAMGYTGRGTILYSIDTGIWPDHPAIGDQFLYQYLPLAQTWKGFDSDTPVDKENSHGTHTVGTVLGLERATNDSIGVAPEAKFIASDPVVSNIANIKNLSEFMPAFEFALNPDGDDETTHDIPDVINNSWGFSLSLHANAIDVDPCTSPIIGNALDAVFVAGIGNVFSAGNSGPNASTIGQPQNYSPHPLNTFTVGAVNGNSAFLPIANFSSRGPTLCLGPNTPNIIKPEVVAPGVDVRSAVNSSGYASYSGTSMAGPHVSGVFLLLKEAFPFLSGEDILEAIYLSATDLGVEGEDNTFGMGAINALAAFNFLAENHTAVPPATNTGFDPSVRILSPSNLFRCSNSVEMPVILFTNKSDSVFLTEYQAALTFVLNGDTLTTQNILVTVEPNATLEIPFDLNPFISSMQTGLNEFSVHLTFNEDLTPVDFNPINNNFYWRFRALPSVAELPFLDTFEGEDALQNWFIINPDKAITWDLRATLGLEDSEQSAFVRLANYSPRQSQRDDLVSPQFNLPAGSKYLEFDYAYQSRASGDRFDTLRVFLSTNCGNDYIEVFKKGGFELSTVPNTGSNFTPSLPTHWAKHFIDLSSYEGDLLVIFQTENRLGNNVYIDNVLITEGPLPVGVNEIKLQLNSFTLFPNPAQNQVIIASNSLLVQPREMHILDVAGKVITRIQPQNTADLEYKVDISNLPAGLYFVRVITQDLEVQTLKFIKN